VLDQKRRVPLRGVGAVRHVRLVGEVGERLVCEVVAAVTARARSVRRVVEPVAVGDLPQHRQAAGARVEHADRQLRVGERVVSGIEVVEALAVFQDRLDDFARREQQGDARRENGCQGTHHADLPDPAPWFRRCRRSVYTPAPSGDLRDAALHRLGGGLPEQRGEVATGERVQPPSSIAHLARFQEQVSATKRNGRP
jgi:hypothetical protein